MQLEYVCFLFLLLFSAFFCALFVVVFSFCMWKSDELIFLDSYVDLITNWFSMIWYKLSWRGGVDTQGTLKHALLATSKRHWKTEEKRKKRNTQIEWAFFKFFEFLFISFAAHTLSLRRWNLRGSMLDACMYSCVYVCVCVKLFRLKFLA